MIQDLIYGTRAGDTYGETLAVVQIDAEYKALSQAIPYTEEVIITLDVEGSQTWGTDKVQVTMQVKTIGPTTITDTNAVSGYRRLRATPVRYIDISVDVIQDPTWERPYAKLPSGRWDLTRQGCLWNPIVHRRNKIWKIMLEFNRVNENRTPENIWNEIMAKSTQNIYANEVFHQVAVLNGENRGEAADLTLFRMITGVSHATMVDIVERSLDRLNDESAGKRLKPHEKRGTIKFPQPDTNNASTSASSPTNASTRKRTIGEDTNPRTKKPKLGMAAEPSTNADKSASDE